MELSVDFREKTRILYWQPRFCYHGKQLTGKEDLLQALEAANQNNLGVVGHH